MNGNPSVKKLCNYCKKEMWVQPHRFKTGRGKFCSKTCLGKSARGNSARHWKGGKIKSNKYIMIYCPDHPRAVHGRYVWEHVLLAEKVLGRYLEDQEVVHHINGNGNDNRLENLYLFHNNRDHIHFHGELRNGRVKQLKSNLSHIIFSVALKIPADN
jgi:hypothetical protein